MRPPTPDKGIEYDLAVICTDKGQHKRVRIATVKWGAGEDSWWMPWLNGKWAPPDPDAGPGGRQSRDSYGFVCPLCPRWPIVSRDRWREIVAGARRAELSELDLSHLE